MKPTAALALALTLTLSLPAAQANRLYKWVDADGKVHYSDKVPPEAAAREREIKSERGMTVDRVERSKTPEELAAERRRREAEEAEREAAAAAERASAERDRILLLTFTSVAEMERARDDRVTAVKGRIALAEQRATQLQGQLERARKEAAAAERSGRGNPAAIYARITQLQQEIEVNRAFIAESAAEQAEISARFAADITRFNELTAERAAARER